ncbi:MAG: hypothetical protein PHS95_02690 [Candidatus Pacebacteria bacterium]|nr:hypothetical protein [Candidatus Paceibacterota bacterium]
MTSSDDSYILIEDSRNLSDDAADSNPKIEEPKEAPSKTLENNGIFVEESAKDEEPSSLKNDFSKELMDQTGVEIIPTKDDEEW